MARSALASDPVIFRPRSTVEKGIVNGDASGLVDPLTGAAFIELHSFGCGCLGVSSVEGVLTKHRLTGRAAKIVPLESEVPPRMIAHETPAQFPRRSIPTVPTITRGITSKLLLTIS